MEAVRASSYSFNSLADLEAFVPPSATPGDSAWVIDNDTRYAITTTAPGAFAVAGYDGVYWEVDTAEAGTETPAPDSVPKTPSGSDTLDPGWIPGPPATPVFDVYASPLGDDVTGDGTIYNPVATIYKATQIAIEHSGGNINFVNNCLVGGPVTGQGLWLRNDGIEVPGFLQLNNSRLRYIGNGNASGATVFGRPGAAVWYPSTSMEFAYDYRLPELWIVGCEVPVQVDYLELFNPPFYGFAAPVRLGWDYCRRNDATLEQLPITSATRAAGYTTHTIDLSGLTAFTILSASRTSNVVTATVQLPSNMRFGPWNRGCPIRVVTSDANFPSIDVTLTDHNDIFPLALGSTVLLTYAQTGADIGATAVTGGTVRTHGCVVKDRIAMFNTTSWSNAQEFPSCCQMRVSASTVDTITVRDPYGYAPRSASVTQANPGWVVKQKRGQSATSAVTFDSCTFFGNQAVGDQQAYGPTVDIGCVSANPIRFNDCQIDAGYNWAWWTVPEEYVDFDRTNIAILGDPGSGGAGSATTAIYNCQSQSGSIRYYGGLAISGGTYLTVNEWLTDGLHAIAAVQWVEGTTFDSIDLNNIILADAGPIPAITLCAGLDPLRCKIGNIVCDSITPVTSIAGFVGPYNVRSAVWSVSPPTPSPWKLGWSTIWPGGLTTPHRGINRALGTLSARVVNEFPAFADWEETLPLPGNVTATQDGEAPDGSMTAIKLVCAGTAEINVGRYPFQKVSEGWQDGGRVMLGIWAKMPTAYHQDFLLGGVYGGAGGIVFENLGVNITLLPVINEGGWQWIYKTAVIQSVGTNGYFALVMDLPTGTSYVWGGTLLYLGPEVSDSDAWETFQNAKHQPIYLPKGVTGTMENVPLVGHGGLGISSTVPKVAGGGSGELTVGSIITYEPRYAEDGTTIIGWAPLYSATINP